MNQLPDLHQATIDETTLDSLFCDISALGQDVEVVPKRNARQQVNEASISLSKALAALRDQSILAAQVRYDYDGQRWCDTLSKAQCGWRLTRINLSEAATT